MIEAHEHIGRGKHRVALRPEKHAVAFAGNRITLGRERGFQPLGSYANVIVDAAAVEEFFRVRFTRGQIGQKRRVIRFGQLDVVR